MATNILGSKGAGISTERSSKESPIFRWIGDVAVKLAASFAWYRTYQTTVRELNALSNKELDDIGIARIDIPIIAMRSASAEQADKHAA